MKRKNYNSPHSKMRSFRLSNEATMVLEKLTERFSTEAQFKVSMVKIIELGLYYIEECNFKDLLTDYNTDENNEAS